MPSKPLMFKKAYTVIDWQKSAFSGGYNWRKKVIESSVGILFLELLAILVMTLMFRISCFNDKNVYWSGLEKAFPASKS